MSEIMLEARNAGLKDLHAILTDQRARRLDVVVPSTALTSNAALWRVDGTVQQITEEGVTTAAGIYRPTTSADRGLAGRLGLPSDYLRKWRETRPDIYDALVNLTLHGGVWDGGAFPADDRKWLVRLLKGDDEATGVARAFLSDEYMPIDNLDILMATLDGVRAAGINAQVDSCDLSDSRMYVRMVAPEVQVRAEELLRDYRNPFGDEFGRWREIAEREGMGYGGNEPIVFAGFKFSNSETGQGSYRLEPEIIVKVCKNGLKLVAQAAKRTVHRGAELDEGILQWSQDTVEKQLALIMAKTRDSVAQWMTEDWVTGEVRKLERQAGVPVTDAPATVKEIIRQTAIPAALEADLLRYFINGGQNTAGGMMQAVAAAAQMVDSADTADEMANAAVPAMAIAARIG